MGEPASVVFRNVGQTYFPETRVDCHYSVSSQHRWSSKDWVGLFQVGWASVKNYHTYTWAPVPEGRSKGVHHNCCAVFQAFYLPRPGPAQYQFVYVNEGGFVWARSPPFTFCSPEPLDDLETVTEERDEEEGERDEEEEEMLLVIPKAQLLKSQLDDSLKGQQGMRLELELSQRGKDEETQRHETERAGWEQERAALQKEISELRADVGQSCDKLRRVEGRNKDVQETGDSLSTELTQLLLEKEEDEQRIRELEEDVQVLSDCGRETDTALERMKERVKKMCDQLKYEEEKRKAVQVEHQAALAAVRALQERLEASERVGEGLRREMGELGLQRGASQGELHQTRLQAARLTLQLSEQELAFKEGQASWAQERDAYRKAAQVEQSKVAQLSREVQCREEWLGEERREREELEADLERQKECNRATLGDAKREAQELRAQLRAMQKESEPQHAERQDLEGYVRHLEQRLGIPPRFPSADGGRLSPDGSGTPESLGEEGDPWDTDNAPDAETQSRSLTLRSRKSDRWLRLNTSSAEIIDWRPLVVTLRTEGY
ncbi:calcium-binding and coiled-coil domain-containing protein 1-like isoform X4 [Gadus chalcogrammus]|uniref:calcium-binding and coiled-coil domain-containing protein 1-like isoform X4 n=1 Tax=Gadus chalcogrammus TaxID=1042646 RepID=UPI0024C4AD72|nr:calcium-binding and coiled-coil domain-containing protein 1-like isoform X4 [Gadus chalcogrammus]